MATPSSTRRVTRSQTLAAMNTSGGNFTLSSKNVEDFVDRQSNSRQKSNVERSALIDITNDSPIVGLAMQTPSSAMTTRKKKSRIKMTPGSGEALLRGQVKTLLQKVEELPKISTLTRTFIHLSSSPMGLVAPTPVNTPQVPNFPGADEVEILIASPVVEEHFRSSQEVLGDNYERKEESLEDLKTLSISRSLLLDFSDNPEPSYEEEEEVGGGGGGDGEVDGLCEGVRKMSVECDKKRVAEFAGKHTRFVYDSDGEEIVDQQQTLGVLRLKGLPTPMGKHFRFDNEQ